MEMFNDPGFVSLCTIAVLLTCWFLLDCIAEWQKAKQFKNLLDIEIRERNKRSEYFDFSDTSDAEKCAKLIREERSKKCMQDESNANL